MLDLNWITKKYFPDLSPHLINRGNCFNWAYIAYMNYDNTKLYSVDEYGGHAFVKIGNRYFDAENPRGVEHWAHLVSIMDMYDTYIEPIEQPIREFLSYWYENGKHPIMVLERKNV
jgi:hypothetical protein